LTANLIVRLQEIGVKDQTVLDIGGGIGAIQHELMDAGAAGVINVDASSAYIAACKEEAEQRGYVGQAAYHHGDFVDLADGLEEADFVTLDRVLCCYDDVDALVQKSASKARQAYAVIYPRVNLLMKIFQPFVNLFARIMGTGFRFYLHPTEHVDGLIRAAGFHPVFEEKRNVWQLALYTR